MKRLIYLFICCLSITVYGQKSFSTGTFQNLESYQLMGSAKIIDGDLSLTRADEWVAGACWYHKKVLVQYGFETEFQFKIDQNGGWQEKGADGIAFVISNDPKGFKVGDLGEGIGYQGISNCLVIEFDTFDNQEGGDNHISIHNNGRGKVTRFNNHSLGRNHKIPELQNTVRKAKITYDFKYIRVYIDGTLYLKKEVHLEKKMKLSKGKAYIGFTSSTAGAYSRHRILNWKWKREKKILATIPESKLEPTWLIATNHNDFTYRLYDYNFYPFRSTKRKERLNYDLEAVFRRKSSYIESTYMLYYHIT
ncbi:MAG: L-type lectin-domain containing protein [Saprospiraceae bacterium]